MASKLIFASVNKFRSFSSVKRSFTAGKIIYNKPATPSSSTPQPPEVAGLSEACVKVPCEPVGPGAAKDTDYKNPEYFSYHQMSYYEAEVEMAKYRLPQPSVDEPYYHDKK